jgi:Protein of unknown function (DUF4238)
LPNEPKLHHFLPEAYLRRFADKRGDLWVIDRKQGVVRRQSPEVTAAERELYTLEDDGGARDRSVESALAGFVDGPGQHAIRVLDEGGRLAGEDAGKLAIFVAALYVRTPAFLEQHRQLAEQMRDSLIRGGVEPAVEPLPESDPEAQRLRAAGGVRADELLAMFNANREERRPHHNDFVRMMVNLVPMLADAIHGLEWFIASAPPGKAFVTCDAPVIITRPPSHSPLMGVGLTTPGSEKIIPLSSRLALLMGDQVARPMVAHITIDRDHLRWINEALVRRCERFVMGRSRVLLESLLKATGIGGSAPPQRSELKGGPGSDVDPIR